MKMIETVSFRSSLDKPGKPHVLITIPCLLSGGTEMQTLSIVKVLISGGYRVTVCCYYEHNETMLRLFRKSRAEIILMELERSKGLFHLIRKLKTVFQKHRPEIVHVQYIAPGLAPIIASKLSDIRTVFATVHQPGRTYGMKAKWLLRTSAFLCTCFFCVSCSVEKSWFGNSEIFNSVLTKARKRKHYTIYNAIDVARIDRILKKTDSIQLKKDLAIEGCLIIGIVGRLREEKGHMTLFYAMADVVKIIPHVRLLVIGDGPERERYFKIANELKLENQICWLGLKSPDEVVAYYSIMNIVVSPSLFEGFGLSAAEAMAAGCPVVASDTDGLREVVENGKTGYLVPVGDSKSLTIHINKLISDPAKCIEMGKKGRKRIEQYFSMKNFVESILNAYLIYKIPSDNESYR